MKDREITKSKYKNNSTKKNWNEFKARDNINHQITQKKRKYSHQVVTNKDKKNIVEEVETLNTKTGKNQFPGKSQDINKINNNFRKSVPK